MTRTPSYGRTGADRRPLPRAADILDALLDQAAGPRRPKGAVPTGAPGLGDLPAGTLTTVVGPPGSRSTWLLLGIALHAAAHGRPTDFYALDMSPAGFARGLAEAIMKRAGGPHGRDDPHREVALRRAANELARLPLHVGVGETTSVHDIAVGGRARRGGLVVVDNYSLLLPSGKASDLKRLAVDLNIAVLGSIALAVPEHEIGANEATVDLLNAADRIACYDPVGDNCLDIVVKPRPSMASGLGVDLRRTRTFR